MSKTPVKNEQKIKTASIQACIVNLSTTIEKLSYSFNQIKDKMKCKYTKTSQQLYKQLKQEMSTLQQQIKLIKTQANQLKLIQGIQKSKQNESLLKPNPLITPNKIRSLSTTIEHPSSAAFNPAINQIVNEQQLAFLSKQNDSLFKQHQETLEHYHNQKHRLQYENEIIINRWLNQQKQKQVPQLQGVLHSDQTIKKDPMFNLIKSLMQQLSKYQTVDEYISVVQHIQNEKMIKEIKKSQQQNQGDTGNNANNANRWFQNVTNQYMLKMAEVLGGNNRIQDNADSDEERIIQDRYEPQRYQFAL